MISTKIKLMISNAAEFLDICQPPAFMGPMATAGKRPRGYDYASASSGILPETGTIVVTQYLLPTFLLFCKFPTNKIVKNKIKFHVGPQLELDRAGEAVQKNR